MLVNEAIAADQPAWKMSMWDVMSPAGLNRLWDVFACSMEHCASCIEDLDYRDLTTGLGCKDVWTAENDGAMCFDGSLGSPERCCLCQMLSTPPLPSPPEEPDHRDRDRDRDEQMVPEKPRELSWVNCPDKDPECDDLLFSTDQGQGIFSRHDCLLLILGRHFISFL